MPSSLSKERCETKNKYNKLVLVNSFYSVILSTIIRQFREHSLKLASVIYPVLPYISLDKLTLTLCFKVNTCWKLQSLLLYFENALCITMLK